MGQQGCQQARRKVAYLSTFGTTQIHLRNPWIIAWWSAAFPGLGHLLLSKYIRGFLLFLWEMVVNLKGHVNEAIYFSFLGDIGQAKLVLDKDWLLLYVATYIFAIWDGYRTAIDINNIYKLAAREDAQIQVFTIDSVEINYLDKRNPVSAAIWSILMPGMGQLYIHRIATATFVLIWWIAVSYLSKFLPAIHYSFLGEIEHAKAVINIQWLMNIPSILMFSLYDAYTNTVENNKLYDWEQAKFLKRQYQYKKFRMPIENGEIRSEGMYIIATFEHNKFLELAVTEMQMKGISKNRILAAPLDKRGEERRLFDTIHASDGLSLIDLAAVFGTIFMLFGAIYGFVLEWGPIWWGIIGLLSGFGLGFLIKLFTTRKHTQNRSTAEKGAEVVLIIECKENEPELVRNILWANHALGVSKMELSNQA